MSISTTIKSIQDIMRKDVGVDGDAQRIGQLVWLLFLKIYDDKEQELELPQDNYRSPIPKKYQWRNWAADPEGMTGDTLLDFVNNELFPSLKELRVAANGKSRGFVVRSVFEDAYQYMKNGTLLRQVINKIQADIDFNDSKKRHLFGDIYEQILKDLQSAGNAGEYYTPRAVTQFMVEMTNPQLDETFFDPACGTGGFLTCSINYLRGKYKKKPKRCVKTPADEETLQASIHALHEFASGTRLLRERLEEDNESGVDQHDATAELPNPAPTDRRTKAHRRQGGPTAVAVRRVVRAIARAPIRHPRAPHRHHPSPARRGPAITHAKAPRREEGKNSVSHLAASRLRVRSHFPPPTGS